MTRKGWISEPAVDVKPASGKQTAVLAGGCFWCTEACSNHGRCRRRDFRLCRRHQGDGQVRHRFTGRTGHAEAVLITYDPPRPPTANCSDLLQRCP